MWHSPVLCLPRRMPHRCAQALRAAQVGIEPYAALIRLLCAAEPAPGALGIGFMSFDLNDATLEAAIACKPHAIWLAFPSPGHEHIRFAPQIKAAGIKLVIMVQTLEQADAAVCNCIHAFTSLYNSCRRLHVSSHLGLTVNLAADLWEPFEHVAMNLSAKC